MTSPTRQTARELADRFMDTELRAAELAVLIELALRSTLAEVERERDDFAGLYKSQAEEYKLARERLMIVAEDAMRAEARVAELETMLAEADAVIEFDHTHEHEALYPHRKMNESVYTARYRLHQESLARHRSRLAPPEAGKAG